MYMKKTMIFTVQATVTKRNTNQKDSKIGKHKTKQEAHGPQPSPESTAAS